LRDPDIPASIRHGRKKLWPICISRTPELARSRPQTNRAARWLSGFPEAHRAAFRRARRKLHAGERVTDARGTMKTFARARRDPLLERLRAGLRQTGARGA